MNCKHKRHCCIQEMVYDAALKTLPCILQAMPSVCILADEKEDCLASNYSSTRMCCISQVHLTNHEER